MDDAAIIVRAERFTTQGSPPVAAHNDRPYTRDPGSTGSSSAAAVSAAGAARPAP
jgi:hypothetical protein